MTGAGWQRGADRRVFTGRRDSPSLRSLCATSGLGSQPGAPTLYLAPQPPGSGARQWGVVELPEVSCRPLGERGMAGGRRKPWRRRRGSGGAGERGRRGAGPARGLGAGSRLEQGGARRWLSATPRRPEAESPRSFSPPEHPADQHRSKPRRPPWTRARTEAGLWAAPGGCSAEAGLLLRALSRARVWRFSPGSSAPVGEIGGARWRAPERCRRDTLVPDSTPRVGRRSGVRKGGRPRARGRAVPDGCRWVAGAWRSSAPS